MASHRRDLDWLSLVNGISAGEGMSRRVVTLRTPKRGPFSLTVDSVERKCVPTYWCATVPGAPRLPSGLSAKQFGPPTISEFKKWVKLNGWIEKSSRASGDHVAVVDSSGRRLTQYDSMGGRGSAPLNLRPSKAVARDLGLQNGYRALWEAIRKAVRLEEFASGASG